MNKKAERLADAFKKRSYKVKPALLLYDFLILFAVSFLVLFIYSGERQLSFYEFVFFCSFAELCVLLSRFIFGVYRQMWRYGGIWCYINLLISDAAAFIVFYIIELFIPVKKIFLTRIFSLFAMNLLLALAMRMVYRYVFKSAGKSSSKERFYTFILQLFGGKSLKADLSDYNEKKNIAIIGAGQTGTAFAEELLNKPSSPYKPRLFIDTDKAKIGKKIYGVPVISEESFNYAQVKDYSIREIVFAIPKASNKKRKLLYEKYSTLGCKLKVYDFPLAKMAGDGSRVVRDFDIEELLFRKQIALNDQKSNEKYTGKVVLITGGGGSIGSELCRQIAKTKPKMIVIVDICENGAYDIKQELYITYKDTVDVRIEILSVTDKAALSKVFNRYRPQIVFNAAAHKHVPLMEHNCIEAVKNNVFGTLNTVELSEEYGVERYIMVSTDKAVNPTNVMGATKRMCEMIVMSHGATSAKTVFTATRFGNVLGSAGSVIPLFKKQIANGGPVTVTDKRIIRYFMTIPEASQLVMQSGAMAENGELFVLDMGKPVKIIELAENIISLSGLRPYVDIDIIETGLRPGEKLYEELLINHGELKKTDNDLIFVEKDEPLSIEEMQSKLMVLKEAVDTGDDEKVRKALMMVVPTYRTPEETNASAYDSKEMKSVL